MVIITFYLLIAIALWLSSWPWWLCIIIYIILYLDLHGIIRYYGLRTHKNSVSTIMPDCDKWRYQLLCGKEYKGTLVKQKSYRSSLILILYIRGISSGRYILIPRDSLSQRQYRYIAMTMQD